MAIQWSKDKEIKGVMAANESLCFTMGWPAGSYYIKRPMGKRKLVNEGDWIVEAAGTEGYYDSYSPDEYEKLKSLHKQEDDPELLEDAKDE